MDKDLATSQQNQPINDKPKRKCSEKQLAALRAGRAKNSRFKPKSAARPDGRALVSDEPRLKRACTDIKPSKDSQ